MNIHSAEIVAWINHKFQINSQYFIKGSFFASLQQFIGVSSGLTVSYFLGHFVSPTVYGEYTLILSILGMSTFLGLPGIDLALPKSIAKGFDGSLLLAKKMKQVISLVGIVTLSLFAIYYYRQNQLSVTQGLIIAAILFPFLHSYTSYPAFLSSKSYFAMISFFSSLSSLFFLLTMTIATLHFSNTPGLVAGYLLGLIIPALFFFYVSLRYVQNNKIDPDLSRYGTFLSLLTVLPWISGNFGNVILERSIGLEALAMYSVGSRFLTAVQKNFQVFYKPVTTKLAHSSTHEYMIILKRHAITLFGIGGVLSLSLYITTPFLIRFFFRPEYHQAIEYGKLLSFALLPLPFSWVVSDMLIFKSAKMPLTVSSTIPQAIKLCLMFVIVPTFGVHGIIGVLLLERFTEPLLPLWFLYKSADRN